MSVFQSVSSELVASFDSYSLRKKLKLKQDPLIGAFRPLQMGNCKHLNQTPILFLVYLRQKYINTDFFFYL